MSFTHAFFCDTFGRRISSCREHWYNILSFKSPSKPIAATTMINAFDGREELEDLYLSDRDLLRSYVLSLLFASCQTASWKSPGFLLDDRIIRSIFSIAEF